MGIFFSKILGSLFGKQEARIVIVGLDGAGKTAILHKLTYNENIQTVPTIGFTLQQVVQGKLQFDMWDIGGQRELRYLWKHYYRNADGLVFVVDSADLQEDRKTEARTALSDALESEDLEGVPLLIFANKQDLQGAASKDQVAECLGLNTISGRDWFVQQSSAITGQGLQDGLIWLSNAVQKRWKKIKADGKQ